MPRLTVDLAQEIDLKLTEFSQKKHITKSETMRRAFALLMAADGLQQSGNKLGIVHEDEQTKELKAMGLVIGV
jgi:hypothetical protein